MAGFSGDKPTEWMDVADRMSGGEKTARRSPAFGFLEAPP